ncbi:MAG TPA: MraY family glycosyltransferase [Roseiflexaceae bacterium]|nr:MraY family glycosyltransferase [Roseiflexaceae bacterium]
MAVGIALAVVFGVAFGITALLVPPVMRLCLQRGWVQQPGGRRRHAVPTGNVGGIAIYSGLAVALIVSLAITAMHPALNRSSFEQLRILLLLAGATLIFLVMWLDDVRELPWLPKFVAQVVAALIIVGPFLWDQQLYPDALGEPTEARGIILTAFNFPFVDQIHLYAISPWLAIIATIFWIGWMSNTINWSDGYDGVAAGVSLIAALMLAIHALRLGQYTIAMLPLAVAGACGGVLLFNLPPARIFMGDSGAELLGFVLGVSAIIGGAKLATILLVLGVPILDVAWLIVSRLAAGRSPMHGARDHLHHRLSDLGLAPRQILLTYYSLSLFFGLLGISDISPAAKLAALTLLVLLGGALIILAARRVAAASAQLNK